MRRCGKRRSLLVLIGEDTLFPLLPFCYLAESAAAALNNIPIFAERSRIPAGDIDLGRFDGRRRSALKRFRASKLPREVTAHTLGTEALELGLDCFLPGLFVAVERVAWLLRVMFLPRRGRGGLHRLGPHVAPLSPGRSEVELGGAVA